MSFALCAVHCRGTLNVSLLIFLFSKILAAFKIIKTWLPEKAVKKINFVNKSTLKNFVEPERALASWGGQDNYEFAFIPEDRNAKGDKKVRSLLSSLLGFQLTLVQFY